MFCEKCGSLLLPTFSAHGWQAACLKCGATQPCDAQGPVKAAELAMQGWSFFAQQEFKIAQARFDEAVHESHGLLEYRWAALLARYGVKYCPSKSMPDGADYVVNFWRTDLPRELIKDTKAYRELADAAAARDPECLKRVLREVNVIDEGLAQIHKLEQNGVAYDIFLCYKDIDAAGSLTPERKFLDALYSQLLGYRDVRVFFAPHSMQGKHISAFEGYIYTALKTAKLMVIATSAPKNVNSPWVKSEWERFLLWDKADRILPIPVNDMHMSSFPPELNHIQSTLGKGVTMSDQTASYYAVQLAAKEIHSRWKETLRKPEPKTKPERKSETKFESMTISAPKPASVSKQASASKPASSSAPESKQTSSTKFASTSASSRRQSFDSFKKKKRIFWSVYIVIVFLAGIAVHEVIPASTDFLDAVVMTALLILGLLFSYIWDEKAFKQGMDASSSALEKYRSFRWYRNWAYYCLAFYALGAAFFTTYPDTDNQILLALNDGAALVPMFVPFLIASLWRRAKKNKP